MYLKNQGGCFTVLLEDKDLPEVYHHLCECYTREDAERIGRLVLTDQPALQVWIQHNWKLKR